MTTTNGPKFNTFLRAAIEAYLGRRIERRTSRGTDGRLRYGWHDGPVLLGATLESACDKLNLMTF
jgi:hypothetical protein